MSRSIVCGSIRLQGAGTPHPSPRASRATWTPVPCWCRSARRAVFCSVFPCPASPGTRRVRRSLKAVAEEHCFPMAPMYTSGRATLQARWPP
jgi:hypothetical protein